MQWCQMKKHRWVFTSASLDTALSELKREGIKFLDFKRAPGTVSREGYAYVGNVNFSPGYYFKVMCDDSTCAKLGWKESK